MQSALEIAKYVIERCNDKGYPITNLKLQKILYFIQAEFLVSTHAPCFYEDIEAWDFGPVVPAVYQRYKVFGSANISTYGRSFSKSIALSIHEKKMIDSMIDDTASYSANQLVEITHNQSPWINSYRRYSNNIISNESIEDFFIKN